MSDINNEVDLIQDISEIDHAVVNTKKKKKEIKALAQQMVDNGESIDPYNPDASRNNRRLNRFYRKALRENQEGVADVPQDLPLAARMNILQERDPARFRDYMQRLDKAAKEGDADSKQLLDEIFETGARDRRGYEGLATAMTVAPFTPFAGASIRTAWKIASNPVVQLAGTATGLYDLTTNQGVKKTIKHFKNNEYIKGIKSMAGDALNASPLIGGWKSLSYGLNAIKNGERFKKIIPSLWKRTDIGRWISPENRAYHAYYTIPQYGYTEPGKRAFNWMKSWMLDKKYYKDPVYPQFEERVLPAIRYNIPDDKKIDLIRAGRTDAYRMYSRMPQKYGVYMQNSDGTFSYNLDKLSEISGLPKEDLIISFNDIGGLKFDYFTSAHASLWNKSDEILYANNHGKQTIIDKWDVHPFSRDGGGVGDYIYTKLNTHVFYPINSMILKAEDKIHNIGSRLATDTSKLKKLYTDDQINEMDMVGLFDPMALAPRKGFIGNLGRKMYNIDFPLLKYNKFVNPLNTMFKNFELGKITGQKPFMLNMELPFNVVEENGKKIYKLKQ